jgi:hypothetical protein
MTTRTPRCYPTIVFVLLLVTLWLPHAEAFMRFEAAAGEDGFSLAYFAPLVGIGSVRLEQPGDTTAIPLRIMFSKIGEIELTLVEVTPDSSALNLHVAATTILGPAAPGGIFEADMPVPFGTYGAVVNLLGTTMPSLGDHAIEAALLLMKNRVSYTVSADLPPLIVDQQWNGMATLEDSATHEELRNPLDDSLLFEVDLGFEHPSDFMATITATISNHTTPPDPEIEEYTITVPNGSYHFWSDPAAPLLPIPIYGHD